MSDTNQDVIAIDFGTTNTYITRCIDKTRNLCPIQFDASMIGIETALLYSNEPADVSPYIGEQAVSGFGMASDSERRKYEYRFRSHFKPDIVESLEARQNAADFLCAVLRDAKKQNIRFSPTECRVFFGVPSEASLQYRRTLTDIARDAGYGEVTLIDEPIGAMLDAISSNMFPLADIISGFLVIDFGGGTCDFAFMQDGRIRHSWGDMFLGGRLFDDLFYRWFCDLNPGKEEKLKQDGDDFFVRTYHCRQWKEKFSMFAATGSAKPFSYLLGEYGRVTDITWDAFLERARRYVPSESFLRFMAESGTPIPENLVSGEIDLLHWFRSSLESGLREKKIAPHEIHVIALAGGSCQWPFVSELCRDVLQNERFFRSDQPYASIANGLAVHPTLEYEFQRKQEELKQKFPDFLLTVHKEITGELAAGRERIVSKVLVELFDEKIRPVLLDFRATGGTVQQLEEKISQEGVLFEQRINQIAKLEIEESMHVLFNMVLDNVRQWLKSNNLRMAEVDRNTRFAAGKIDINSFDPQVADTIVAVINAVIGAVVTVIVANICGGGGMALLATGPLGLLLGAILGIAITILTVKVGKTKAMEMAKSFNIPANLSPVSLVKLNPLNAILSDRKIEKCRENMRCDLAAKLEGATLEILHEVDAKVELLIRDEIARLSIVNIK